MPLHDANRIAGTFRGFPSCACLSKWLPVYEQELLRVGVIKHNLDLYQLIGGAAASGGTHTKGGAVDTGQTSDTAIWTARQMGADAGWHRRKNWDGKGGMEHAHLVLRGCPHNGPARYQIDAVDAGFNGLGHLGHQAPDDGPRPLSKRTWAQGIAWANKRIYYPEPRKAEDRAVYHVDDYALNDSFAGILAAKRKKFKWIDLNFHVTKDGRLVCTHWAQPLANGWHDPRGKIPKDRNVWEMTFDEVRRLRNGKHPSLVIKTAGEMLEFANTANMNVEFEAKGNPLWVHPAPWDRLDLVIKRKTPDISVVVKMLSTFKTWPGALEQAKASGRTTMLLPRGTRRAGRTCWRYVDAVRGPVLWTGAVPKRSAL